jgi:hypothetical protein
MGCKNLPAGVSWFHEILGREKIMIREIIRPQTNQVIVQIPQDMVDKELELIVFAIKQDTGTGIQKIKSRQLMDKIFEHAESATIPEDVDIDEIMNDMNNALP